MIGNNELTLNQATLCQAVQEWIDRRMPTTTVKVTGVKANSNQYDNTFLVSLSSSMDSSGETPK